MAVINLYKTQHVQGREGRVLYGQNFGLEKLILRGNFADDVNPLKRPYDDALEGDIAANSIVMAAELPYQAHISKITISRIDVGNALTAALVWSPTLIGYNQADSKFEPLAATHDAPRVDTVANNYEDTAIGLLGMDITIGGGAPAAQFDFPVAAAGVQAQTIDLDTKMSTLYTVDNDGQGYKSLVDGGHIVAAPALIGNLTTNQTALVYSAKDTLSTIYNKACVRDKGNNAIHNWRFYLTSGKFGIGFAFGAGGLAAADRAKLEWQIEYQLLQMSEYSQGTEYMPTKM